MPPESAAPLEMVAPVDRLRDILGRGQMITLEIGEKLWGIELDQRERAKYQSVLEIAAQELVRLVENGVYGIDTLHRHGAYLYPQLQRVALKGDSVISTMKALRQRFGVEYEANGKRIPTFGAMNSRYVERVAGDAYQRSSLEPAWVLTFTVPFGGRREDTQHAVAKNLENFNKDEKGRFKVANLRTAVNAALIEALGPIGSSLRSEDGEARRLTDTPLDDGKQAWVTRRPNKNEKSLIEIDPRKTKFRKNEGFFIAWEFPVEL